MTLIQKWRRVNPRKVSYIAALYDLNEIISPPTKEGEAPKQLQYKSFVAMEIPDVLKFFTRDKILPEWEDLLKNEK